MASHHIGYELITIETDEVVVTIYGELNHHVGSYDSNSSSVKVSSKVYSLSVLEQELKSYSGTNNINIEPIFFENRSYEFLIHPKNFTDLSRISIWHDNNKIREKLEKKEKFNLISGIINFDNNVGYSKFIVSIDGKEYLSFTIEIFPTKIDYKKDYKEIINDVTEEIYSLIFDFLRKTYQGFKTSPHSQNTMVEYFVIIKKAYAQLMKSVDVIISNPYHVLKKEHQIQPHHKIKKIDTRSIKWIQKHPTNISVSGSGYNVSNILAVKKENTFDVFENRFVKHVISTAILKLNKFKKCYLNNGGGEKCEQFVLDEIDSMSKNLRNKVTKSFLNDVSSIGNLTSMSLVFSLSPGYRDVYKNYLLLSRGLDIGGDLFDLSVKDLSVLYEYWCFIKLNKILRDEYHLVSSDFIKIKNDKIYPTLVKGGSSSIVYSHNGSLITLSYNCSMNNLPTVNQKPDNILKIERKDPDGYSFQYVFDAKYRLDMADKDSDYYRKYGNSGPKEDDINTMHRYRDAIVYSYGDKRYHVMVGAFILFPYDKGEELFKNHHFYQSIGLVNIGGLPFLPNKTELARDLIHSIINNPRHALDTVIRPPGELSIDIGGIITDDE